MGYGEIAARCRLGGLPKNTGAAQPVRRLKSTLVIPLSWTSLLRRIPIWRWKIQRRYRRQRNRRQMREAFALTLIRTRNKLGCDCDKVS